MRSARSVYRLTLALAGLGGVAVLVGASVAVRGIDLGSASPERLARDCQRFLLPRVTLGSSLVLALGLLGAIVIALALRSAARQLRDYRCFLHALAVVGVRHISGMPVRIVDSPTPEAFCAGLLRTRIYLSSAADAMLTSAELEAVIAHEAHHARRHDPLRILLVGILADALFFLPALRRLNSRYEELAEVAADEAAVGSVGDPAPLAAALLRFGERGGPGVVGIAAERVDHLLGDQPRWELPVSLVTGALVTAAGLLAIAIATANAAGGDRVSVVMLATQSCMVVMTALPAIAIASLAVLGGRAVARRGR